MSDKMIIGTETTAPVIPLDVNQCVAVHEDYKVRAFEELKAGRNRKKGTFVTHLIDDLMAFLKREEVEQAPIFVNKNAMSAKAILNYDVENFAQGHCDFTAVLKLEKTYVWQKLINIHQQCEKGNAFKQKEFSILLEDWINVFVAKDEHGNDITMAKAINAVRNMEINASAKVETATNHLAESKSKFEKVEATSKDSLPVYFEIKDSCYEGLNQHTIKLRVIVRTVDENPHFVLQIVSYDKLQNDLVNDFKDIMLDRFINFDVMIGDFDAF